MKGTGATTATRGTGRSGGTVGATPTGIELGLNVGIGQLGISTDYGGGIVIGIGGQKIVWGREGGKIHYNFGGLEVIVEARDCVVVETRKMWGQVVGRHVYPDPGCKPEPPSTPSTGGTTNKNLGLPAEEVTPFLEDNKCYHVVFLWHAYIQNEFKWEPDPNIFQRASTASDIHGGGVWINNQNRFYAKVDKALPYERTPAYIEFHDPPSVPLSQAYLYPNEFKKYKANFKAWASINGKLQIHIPGGYKYNEQILMPWDLFNTGAYIKNYIQQWRPAGQIWDLSAYEIPCNYFSSGTPGLPKKIGIPQSFIPSPSAGNQPPMPESCCEALAADIEDIKEVLACKEILAGKMTFPWSWRMPGGQGEEIIMDYPNLLRAIAQQIDHLGIHPPKLSIKDINNAIAGDQSLTNQFPSVTQAFEALMAQVWDANADVDTLTNFLYRLAWLSVQQSFNLAQVTGTVESLKDMIGGETEPTETTLTTPFNIAAGTGAKEMPPGKGFGKQANESNAIDNRINANTEMSTEAMLPKFLKIRENPILVDTFTGKQDIFDILMLIRMDLEKLKNK
ncbi:MULTISPECIES: hypothetical protein [unclassified Microcoleus]|uniref:hypothetical protein n=1 Tax=unclassified Microcoleus TaxID=2642155 RepID=UPI002FD204A2